MAQIEIKKRRIWIAGTETYVITIPKVYLTHNLINKQKKYNVTLTEIITE